MENRNGKKIVMKCRLREQKERIMQNKIKITWKVKRTKEKFLERSRELRRKGIVEKIGYIKVLSEREVWSWNEKEKN